jgi:hypothetical protein
LQTASSKGGQESIFKMLNDCQKYALAINAKDTPFPTEPLIMALLLSQHKMIGWLSEQIRSDQKKAILRRYAQI